MTVLYRKSRKKWIYHFRINHKRYTGICKDHETGELAQTRTEAKKVEAKIKARIFTQQQHRVSNHMDYTFGQAIAVYISQGDPEKTRYTQKVYARELINFFGVSTPLRHINDTRALEYIAWARKQKVRVWAGGQVKKNGPFPKGKTEDDFWVDGQHTRTDSTINRYLDALRKTLRMAHNARDPESGIPLLLYMPKIPKLKEPKHLPRPINPDDLERIIDAAPPHLADAIQLAVWLGLRKNEVLNLKIDQIDMHKRGIWLQAADTKADRDEFIPAGSKAMELLIRLVERARELNQQHLILYKTGGKVADEKWRPVKNAQSAWERTLEKVGLKGLHVFHNTKATFVTAIAQKMPAHVTQKMARHKDFSTTQVYIGLLDSTMREASDIVDAQFGKKRIQKAHPTLQGTVRKTTKLLK